jgi:hypothetical protein
MICRAINHLSKPRTVGSTNSPIPTLNRGVFWGGGGKVGGAHWLADRPPVAAPEYADGEPREVDAVINVRAQYDLGPGGQLRLQYEIDASGALPAKLPPGLFGCAQTTTPLPLECCLSIAAHGFHLHHDESARCLSCGATRCISAGWICQTSLHFEFLPHPSPPPQTRALEGG